MAFSEVIYLTLEGGVVIPISKVTSQLATSNVVIYDGSTYRDDPVEMLGFSTAEATGTQFPIPNTYIGSTTVVAAGLSDVVAHVAPRYLGKQRTLWTFARTVNTAAGFSHVVWADLVMGTSDFAPYRLGMTPTVVTN